MSCGDRVTTLREARSEAKVIHAACRRLRRCRRGKSNVTGMGHLRSALHL
jgi:hypothetical protein